MSSRPLSSRVAIVTGSTSGIGLGIATVLAAAGCEVVLNGFGDASEIRTLEKRLSAEHHVRISYHGADMSKPAEIKSLIDFTVKEHGRLDILVNNAGIQFTANVEDFPEEKWNQILAINLSSAFHTTKHAIPHMRKNGWGRIVNIASVHGLIASHQKSAYVTSKHGVVGLTKVVALENAQGSITCNAICPGWVLTPLVEKQIQAKAEEKKISFQEATKQLLSEKQPSLRFTLPEEVGELVKFLCSSAAGNVTGVAIPMDGGWSSL